MLPYKLFASTPLISISWARPLGRRAETSSSSASSPPDRSWQTAVQNINGLTSILTLLPVLTGKNQNIKIAASRVFPASAALAGIGAGRVLAKLQLGILLCSFDLYRNTIDDLSVPHDEYVNHYAPELNHFPTGTAERHASGKIESHNLAETYMVEAWFRTQGQPSIVTLRLNSWRRAAVGLVCYLILYGVELYLSYNNAAIGTGPAFAAIQGASVILWMTGIVLQQRQRGQGKKPSDLNQNQQTRKPSVTSEDNANSPSPNSGPNKAGKPLDLPKNVIRLNDRTAHYRCFQLPIYGDHVKSEVFGIGYENINQFQLYPKDYQTSGLLFAGVLIMLSALLDVISTLLIVGYTNWAYPWLGYEVLILLAKVVFCLEPLRHTEMSKVALQNGSMPNFGGPPRLPITLATASNFQCCGVYTDYNIIQDVQLKTHWRSDNAGVYIGQKYHRLAQTDDPKIMYLAFDEIENGDDKFRLKLSEVEPIKQENDVMQREFLAALKLVIEANKVPSKDFIAAVDRTVFLVRRQMTPKWSDFGSKTVRMEITRAKHHRLWRIFV